MQRIYYKSCKRIIKKLNYEWEHFKDKQNTCAHVFTVTNNLLSYLVFKSNKYNTKEIKEILKLITLFHDIGKNNDIFKSKILNSTKQFSRSEKIDLLKIHVLQAPFFLHQYNLESTNYYHLVLATSVLHHRIRQENKYPSKIDLMQANFSEEEKVFLIKTIDRIDELLNQFIPNKYMRCYVINNFNLGIDKTIIENEENYFNLLINEIVPEYLSCLINLNKKNKVKNFLEIEVISVITIILAIIDILSSTNRPYQNNKMTYDRLQQILISLKLPSFLTNEFLQFLNMLYKI